MKLETCQIIGGGHAGVEFACNLRKQGWPGKINIVSLENEMPYQKPPLSKSFLFGAQKINDILIKKEGFLKKKISK